VQPFAPGFPLGDRASRGHRPRYGKTPPPGQRAPFSPADLPAQRMQAQIPSAVSQPALLSGSGMPAGSPSLARGAAEGQTSPGRRRQNQARPGREGAPSASEVLISDRFRTQSLRRRVVTQLKLFSHFHCAIGRAATNTLPARRVTWHATAAPPAGRPFAMSWIVNANGSLAAPRRGGRSGPSSTKTRAGAAFCYKAAYPTRSRLGRLHGDGPPRLRRSSIIACPPAR